MTPKEIIEGNQLIVEFYGDISGITSYPDEGYEFHSSWDWLMPVVEKIESIKDEYHGRFGVHISSNTCTIQATNFRSNERMAEPPYYFITVTVNTKLDATWLVVVQFIKWYNFEKTLKNELIETPKLI